MNGFTNQLEIETMTDKTENQTETTEPKARPTYTWTHQGLGLEHMIPECKQVICLLAWLEKQGPEWTGTIEQIGQGSHEIGYLQTKQNPARISLYYKARLIDLGLRNS